MYPVHTIESAPEKSKGALTGLKNSFGFIPNLAATMATSPVLVNGFVGAFGNFHGGSFTGAERQALLLANAVANGCTWAVAFHSTMAAKEGVPADAIRAIRERRVPNDARIAKLTQLTRALIEKRGHVDAADVEGMAPSEILEVIAGLAVSVMANYAGNITKPVLEPMFEAQAWR